MNGNPEKWGGNREYHAANAKKPSIINSLRRKFVNRRTAAIIAVVALCLPIVIAAAGLATEGGYWYLQKQRLQLAANSGAIAIAIENDRNYLVNLTAAATNAVNRTAYADVIVTVTVSYPPRSGLFASQTGSAEVVVSRSYSTYFVSLFGLDKITIAARAVASIGEIVENTGAA